MLFKALPLLAALLTLQACNVSPFCTECLAFDASFPELERFSGGTSGSAVASGNGQNGVSGGGAFGSGEGGRPGERDASVVDAAEPCGEIMTELCNGRDDDCDLRVDEEVVIADFNCGDVGVCAGTQAVCIGGAPVCRYGADHEVDETLCDELDNDCDGRVDEAFAALGDACIAGIGACSATGLLRCNAVGDALDCEVSSMPAPQGELCDGIDNDCDGLVDEPRAEPGLHASFVEDALAELGDGVQMFVYEASRPDATSASRGTHTARACSKPDVLPWTGVSFATAQQACQDAGYRLCTQDEWLRACEGTSASAFPYGASYAPESCNGVDRDADASQDGIQSALLPTASLASCESQHGIFDLSGNAKEWTDDFAGVAAGQALYVVRGGSYQSPEYGLQCQALLSQAIATTVLPTLGFRCCVDQTP